MGRPGERGAADRNESSSAVVLARCSSAGSCPVAACHGEEGEGEGESSYVDLPGPNYFTLARFMVQWAGMAC